MGLTDLLLPVPGFEGDSGWSSGPWASLKDLGVVVKADQPTSKRKKAVGEGFLLTGASKKSGKRKKTEASSTVKLLRGSAEFGRKAPARLKQDFVQHVPSSKSKEGGGVAVPDELERRARKNAKRKQRREKKLALQCHQVAALGGTEKQADGGHVDDSSEKPPKKRARSRVDADEDVAETAVGNLGEDGETRLAGEDQPSQPTGAGKPSSFLQKIQSRLWGGQFRMLNETLYTCKGEEALALFRKDPSSFDVYHAGYQEQMSRWPRRPVDVIADWLRTQGSDLIVADFGCGDGRLAKMVKNKVFSLDLVATNPSVIACNMAHTPLQTSSVDVAVFCLSLMGTDYPSYLKEAQRVLKPSGWLLIAEVKSRFDVNNGGANLGEFSQALKSLGFSPHSQDMSNKMFLLLHFKNQARKPRNHPKAAKWPELKACIYKRR